MHISLFNLYFFLLFFMNKQVKQVENDIDIMYFFHIITVQSNKNILDIHVAVK